VAAAVAVAAVGVVLHITVLLLKSHVVELTCLVPFPFVLEIRRF
jgi:hypothetical protein